MISLLMLVCVSQAATNPEPPKPQRMSLLVPVEPGKRVEIGDEGTVYSRDEQGLHSVVAIRGENLQAAVDLHNAGVANDKVGIRNLMIQGKASLLESGVTVKVLERYRIDDPKYFQIKLTIPFCKVRIVSDIEIQDNIFLIPDFAIQYTKVVETDLILNAIPLTDSERDVYQAARSAITAAKGRAGFKPLQVRRMAVEDAPRLAKSAIAKKFGLKFTEVDDIVRRGELFDGTFKKKQAAVGKAMAKADMLDQNQMVQDQIGAMMAKEWNDMMKPVAPSITRGSGGSGIMHTGPRGGHFTYSPSGGRVYH